MCGLPLSRSVFMSLCWDSRALECLWTHKSRPATGCVEGVVLCSHPPADQWKQDIHHTQLLRSQLLAIGLIGLTIDIRVMAKTQAFSLMPQTLSFTSTTAQQRPIVTFHLSTPNLGVNELVMNSFTSRQELHSKP